MTTHSDSYNGWCNRETWAVNLHLSSDEGLYHATLYSLASADDPCDVPGREYGEIIHALVDDLFEEHSDDPLIQSMIHDVGSLWRVDWDEIGKAWIDS